MAKSARTKRKEKAPEPSGVKMLTYEESLAYFDDIARRYVGMSGEEFLKAWNEGKYKDVDIDTPELMRVVMLLPLTVPPASVCYYRCEAMREGNGMAKSARTKKKEKIPEPNGVKMLTYEEGLEVFDRAARRYLDMSGEEFLKAWNEGKYKDVDIDTTGLIRVVMLLPFTVPPEAAK